MIAWLKWIFFGMFGLPVRKNRRMTVYHFDDQGNPDVFRYWDSDKEE
jgi:hypothetical protein